MLPRRSLSLLRRASTLGCGGQLRRCSASSSLEYASSCYLPTSWLELPLVAKRDHNHDSTLYSFGLPEGDHATTATATATSSSTTMQPPTTASVPTCILPHITWHDLASFGLPEGDHTPARSRRSRRSSRSSRSSRSRRSCRSRPLSHAVCQARRSTCPRARACCCGCRAHPTTPCARTLTLTLTLTLPLTLNLTLILAANPSPHPHQVRPYTPISEEAKLGSFDLLVKRYPEGAASQYLHELSVGDAVGHTVT